MSVINQMLKDLEQRSPEHAATMPVSPKKKTTIKTILLITLVLLSLNVLGFYFWHVQTQAAPSELKASQTISAKSKEKTKENQSVKEVEVVKQKPVPQTEHQPVLQSALPPVDQGATKPVAKSLPQQVALTRTKPTPELAVSAPVLSRVPASTTQKITKGKMSVSRRQLTPKALVAQKVTQAERAIMNNDIAKVEQLFEEILIIEPEHKQARKKLAALWFGRQAYQQAVNLLSQGIAIDRLSAEMRLMKAQIQLKQGQQVAAFNTLKPLNTIENEEYQVMLANISLQIEQYDSAINAYQVLINMQPYSGRWHLGLAIVYDKSGQFSLALNEYTLAIAKADLSVASANFAQQRMQVLGE